MKILQKDNRADSMQNIEEYQTEILDAATNIGKDNLISINDHGYIAYIWYWEEE